MGGRTSRQVAAGREAEGLGVRLGEARAHGVAPARVGETTEVGTRRTLLAQAPHAGGRDIHRPKVALRSKVARVVLGSFSLSFSWGEKGTSQPTIKLPATVAFAFLNQLRNRPV